MYSFLENSLAQLMGLLEQLENRPTSRLDTRFIMRRSGRSMVLAMVRTTSRASLWVGQSKRLYIMSCFWVHRRSSCQEMGRDAGSTTETELGPRSEACYHCFSFMCSQVTPPARTSIDTCLSPPEWRKKAARTFLPPSICSRDTAIKCHATSSPVLPWAPPYLVHKQHSGFPRGPSSAESLSQQFCGVVSCCPVTRQPLRWGGAGRVGEWVVNCQDFTALA